MGLFFAMWFASGMVMLFVPFPGLDPAQRYRALLPIDVASIRVAPADLAATYLGPTYLGPTYLGSAAPGGLELIQRATGPAWLLHPATGPIVAIDAATGEALPAVSPAAARAVARRFVDADTKAVLGPYDDDQWIVHQNFNAYRPFYRVDLRDRAATRVYVSARTGEILQATTRTQRIANWVGSVVHWIYPTILRRYPTLWSYTVWAIALAGIATGGAGFWLGWLRTLSALRHARAAKLSPFRALFKLHHLLGLTVGIFLLGWIVSGWLSVDHGLLFPTGAPDPRETASFRGISLQQAARQVGRDALAGAGAGVSLSIDAVDGHAVLSLHRADGGVRTTILHGAIAMDGIPAADLLRGARRAWPWSRPTLSPIAADDDYAHLLYDGLPDDAVRLRLGAGSGTWVDVSTSNGRIIDVIDWRRRLYRWLFNGLHTFDVPGLNRHPLLRELVMLPILSTGLLLSLTGVTLGFKRLRRSVLRRPVRPTP